MDVLTSDALRGLLQSHEAPCVSIYLRTHRHHPENQQDPIRYRNMLRTVEDSLRQHYSGRETRPLLEPLHHLAQDANFWKHTLDGLAVLSSAGTFRVYCVQRVVPDLAVVADNFHIKPLLRVVQSADRYQVLALSRQTARMYEGNRDALDEIKLTEFPTTLTAALGDQVTSPERTMHTAGGATLQHGMGSKKDEIDKDTERYFRIVDDAVIAQCSKPTGLPLILAALPEHHAVFRRLSRNSALHTVGIENNPEALTLEQLKVAAWKAIESTYHTKLAKLAEDFSSAAAHQRGTADLSDAARAAIAGRVGVLLVDADQVVPGRIDPTTGAVTPGNLNAPDVGDMLDDLAEAVIRMGGEVVVVPKEKMPSASGLAATFRY